MTTPVPMRDEDVVETGGGRSWLGVWLGDAVDGGVKILAIVPGGPAELAELRAGDIILEADRQPVPAQEELSRVLDRLRPGDPLRLVVLRSGRSLEKEVKLGDRSPRRRLRSETRRVVAPRRLKVRPVLARGAVVEFGLQVASVTPALRAHYGAPEDAGVLVTRSIAESAAGRSGIKVGDVLVRIDERDILTPTQLTATIATWSLERPLGVVVVRDGRSQSLSISPEHTTVGRARSEQRRADRELLRSKLELELERLEKRVERLKRELRDLEEQH